MSRTLAARRAAGSVGAVLALAGLAAAVPADAAAQRLAERARATPSVDLRLTFPARPDVCGAGDAILIREPDGSTMFFSGRSRSDADGWRQGEPPCVTGLVVATLRRGGGQVSDVWLRVVRDPDAATADDLLDLGAVSGGEAADFLLAEAERATSRGAERLIAAAALARDAEIWPRLLRLGRDRSLPARTRRAAIHWLGRQAAAEAVAEVGGIVRDATEEDGIREAAVFALSQLSDDRAIPLLIDVVRTVEDPRIRGRALFWLAESEDPRALALFEEILAGGGA